MILISLGLKRKGFIFEKGNILWAGGKKFALVPIATTPMGLTKSVRVFMSVFDFVHLKLPGIPIF